MNTITIIGYEQETECQHCGKALKHGIRTAEFGIIGADCFVKLIARNQKLWNGGKPTSSWIRELAQWMQFASESKRLRNGMRPETFVFEIAA